MHDTHCWRGTTISASNFLFIKQTKVALAITHCDVQTPKVGTMKLIMPKPLKDNDVKFLPKASVEHEVEQLIAFI